MGNWQYISGGEVTINHWSGGVPSGGEYCVEAFGWNQLWNDVGCGSIRPSICELPAGTYIVTYCLKFEFLNTDTLGFWCRAIHKNTYKVLTPDFREK